MLNNFNLNIITLFSVNIVIVIIWQNLHYLLIVDWIILGVTKAKSEKEKYVR